MCMAPDVQSTHGNEYVKNQIAAKSTYGTKYGDDAAKGLSVASFARDQGMKGVEAAGNLSESQLGDLGKMNTAMGAGFSFLGHFFGDERVAETGVGHAANSAVKTGGDLLTGAVGSMKGANGKLNGGNPFAQIVAAADGFVDVDNPLKMGTALTSELLPTSQAGKMMNGGVDAFTSLGNFAVGDDAAAYQSADVVQENSVNGTYSALTQFLTYGVAALTGDRETLNKATDQKAKTGERGVFSALGNMAADGWMPDEDRSVEKVNLQEDLDWHKNTPWYAPWRH
jgi:hypothetical protein